MKFFIAPCRIVHFGWFPFTVFLCLLNYNAEAQKCTLSKPQNIKVVSAETSNATVTWDAVPDASYYQVKYKKKGTPDWSPKMNIGADNTYTFGGLSPATTYTFSVAAFCSNDKSSGNRTTTGTTAECCIPTVSSIQILSENSVSISWEGCSSGLDQIRYKIASNQLWTYASSGGNQNITLTNLTTNSTYVFQLNACADTFGNWSALDTFALQSSNSGTTRPNILLIILDDARFDSYSCNGAPEFFKSPNIDRIANEGVNFKTSFCVESYCTPSRGSIVTGLYPHNHGATNNVSNIYSNLPTTASILDSAGYSTGWIGKYHLSVSPQKGYDYWFATKVNSGTDEYNNMKYNYNGALKTVNGHDTKIVTDSALAFLDKNADTSFFVTMAYHAPHNPFIPQNEFNGIYNGENIPLADDLEPYSENYPSCVYKLNEKHYIDAPDVEGNYQKYYELMAGVDEGIGKVLQKLSDLGILDNTCIIFTSDNGFMMGEHGFFMKQLAYDPSSRVPMFIRYPAWFGTSTIVTDQMALNVDIAPTILEAAGVQGNYSFDGVSMKKLADHSLSRNAFYYEYVQADGTSELPYIRSVRTFDSKLIKYGCNQSVQEFFDLDNDNEENTNRIFDPLYATAISSLTSQMNEFRGQFNDITESIIDCSLMHIILKDENGQQMDEESLPYVDDNLTLFPNPANDQLNVAFAADNENDDASLLVTDMLGSQLIHEKIKIVKGTNLFEMKLDKKFSEGSYMITIISNDVRTARPFLVQR